MFRFLFKKTAKTSSETVANNDEDLPERITEDEADIVADDEPLDEDEAVNFWAQTPDRFS